MSNGLAAATGVVQVAGFLLEVAMVAALCFWGFMHPYPWNVVLGLGVPAVVVVLWGIFMAPKAVRRLAPVTVAWVSLGVFLASAVALMTVALGLGLILAGISVVYGAAVLVLLPSSKGRRRL
jgi:hypothetical protein